VFSKSADKWDWAASGAVVGDGHTSTLTHRSITIVADGRLEVCDVAHRMFVMKEVKRPSTQQNEAWVPTDRPFSSVDKCVFLC